MLKDGLTDLDLRRPRTIAEILGASLRLYARLPLLFIFLAGIVVVPYEVVVVVLSNGRGTLSVSTELILLLIELALIDPFIAALQVQALVTMGDGERPEIKDVIRRGVAVLPVVAAAEIIAGIGIAVGVLFFIIPGLILALRWAVVAQVAAVEHTNWPTALRRSGELARRNYWRILMILVIVGILNELPADVTGSAGHTGPVIAGIALAVIVHSFGTLLTSFLYFDLRARESIGSGAR
jgi:hypothetical protein